MAVPPYGVAIQQAIASGKLDHMKKLAQEAQAYLAEHGDLSAALELLKLEIAKHEQKSK